MSTDSKDPNPHKPSGTPERKSKEVIEMDLWDLDFENGEAEVASDKTDEIQEPEKTETPLPVVLPDRRPSESLIQSRKPVERKIDAPVVIEDKVEEEQITGSEQPVEKEVKEKTTKQKKAEKLTETTKSTEPETLVTEEEPASTEDQDAIDTAVSDDEQNLKNGISGMVGSLSKTEKIGISVLIAVFALGATITALYFFKVPTRSLISEKLDLPIEGKLIKVTSAATFWREPVTSGESADVVRRGTKLIPVIKIDASAKSAAIRVLFRNEDGSVIGDPINRTIKGKASFTIPATAGFNDIGMHAAYRTGESQPWTVQILEAPESDVSINKFTKLLETEISTDVR